MSDNSAGTPANAQSGPEVSAPDEAASSQISTKNDEEIEHHEEIASQEQEVPAVTGQRPQASRPRIGDTRPAPATPSTGSPVAAVSPDAVVADVAVLRAPGKPRAAAQKRPSRQVTKAATTQKQPLAKDPATKDPAQAVNADDAS